MSCRRCLVLVAWGPTGRSDGRTDGRKTTRPVGRTKADFANELPVWIRRASERGCRNRVDGWFIFQATSPLVILNHGRLEAVVE